MNIIGKLIGLIALVFIILIVVNFKTILPQISKLMFGGSATTSVTAITDDLIKQVKAIYPVASIASYSGSDANNVQVYTTIRSLTTKTSYSNDFNTTNPSLIVFTHSGNSLSMVTENIDIPEEMKGSYNFWLTNEMKVSTSTKYIDFGTVRYGGRQMYIYNLGLTAKTFSFKEYRYLKIINPKNLNVFTESVLQ